MYRWLHGTCFSRSSSCDSQRCARYGRLQRFCPQSTSGAHLEKVKHSSRRNLLQVAFFDLIRRTLNQIVDRTDFPGGLRRNALRIRALIRSGRCHPVGEQRIFSFLLVAGQWYPQMCSSRVGSQRPRPGPSPCRRCAALGHLWLSMYQALAFQCEFWPVGTEERQWKLCCQSGTRRGLLPRVLCLSETVVLVVAADWTSSPGVSSPTPWGRTLFASLWSLWRNPFGQLVISAAILVHLSRKYIN